MTLGQLGLIALILACLGGLYHTWMIGSNNFWWILVLLIIIVYNNQDVRLW